MNEIVTPRDGNMWRNGNLTSWENVRVHHDAKFREIQTSFHSRRVVRTVCAGVNSRPAGPFHRRGLSAPCGVLHRSAKQGCPLLPLAQTPKRFRVDENN